MMLAWKERFGTAFLSLGLIAPVAGGPGPGMGGPGDPRLGPGSTIGHMGYELEHNLVLPQIAAGKDVSTTLVLASQAHPERLTWLEEEDLLTDGTVYFFHQDGTPMPVEVNGAVPASRLAFQLRPSQMLVLEIRADGPNMPGWALIAVEEDGDEEEEIGWGRRNGFPVYRGERVMATAFYTLTGDQGELISRVGVIPSVYQRDHFFTSSLVAEFGTGVNTGLAIVNTSSERATLWMQLRDPSGQVVAETELALDGGNQKALFIDELFPGDVPDGFIGTLEMTTEDDGILVMGLLMSQGILTSVPTYHFGTWQPGAGIMP